MELTISKNIRSFRKEKKMTQEQLADVLGVTVGAVHKWETGLSLPELNLIVEMADFFDTSVDVLLGYRMKDNRLDSVVDRLFEMARSMDPEAPAEAEKALGRYPNSFEVVNACASIYLSYGTSLHDLKLLRRALELLELKRMLLPQNNNPRISESTISSEMSGAYFILGEQEKAIEILKENNAGGFMSHDIGCMLAVFMNRPEEAAKYLSEGMLCAVSILLNVLLGYVFLYRSRNDWDSALAVTTLIGSLMMGLKRDGEPGFMDKTCAEVLLILGYARAKAGLKEASVEALREAAELAARFDSTPEYTLRTVRFLEGTENSNAYDTLGVTAFGSIETLLDLLKDDAFTAQWKEMTGDGTEHSEKG